MENDYSGYNWVTCPMCKGLVTDLSNRLLSCTFCRATGKVKTKLLDGIINFLCPECGWAHSRASNCKTCDNTGIVDWVTHARGIIKK